MELDPEPQEKPGLGDVTYSEDGEIKGMNLLDDFGLDDFRLVDFRLGEVSGELDTLKKHLELIEEEIKRGEEAAKAELDAKLRPLYLNKQELSLDERDEEHNYREEYYYQIDFVLPRVLRVPFLVALFAVYETAVIEVASHIQKKRGGQISRDDFKGDLLNRAKKYYKRVLQFELSSNNKRWERLTVLAGLRNAIAHTNGRLDMIEEQNRKKMEKILKLDGVKDELGFVIVSGAFLRETFTLVKDDLEDLVARYKEWDTAYKA